MHFLQKLTVLLPLIASSCNATKYPPWFENVPPDFQVGVSDALVAGASPESLAHDLALLEYVRKWNGFFPAAADETEKANDLMKDAVALMDTVKDMDILDFDRKGIPSPTKIRLACLLEDMKWRQIMLTPFAKKALFLMAKDSFGFLTKQEREAVQHVDETLHRMQSFQEKSFAPFVHLHSGPNTRCSGIVINITECLLP